MLLRKCSCRTEEAWLRVGNQLHRHVVHASLEASLRDEAVAEAGSRKIFGHACADSTRNDDCHSTLRQSQITCNRSQGQAEAIKRRIGETVGTRECRLPQLSFAAKLEVPALDRAKCL